MAMRKVTQRQEEMAKARGAMMVEAEMAIDRALDELILSSSATHLQELSASTPANGRCENSGGLPAASSVTTGITRAD